MRLGGKESAMRVFSLPLSLRFAMCVLVCLVAIPSWAAAAPDFTISATNATINAAGKGTTNFTLTSQNGYTGSVFLSCAPANPPAGAQLPYCGAPAIPEIQLAADATVTGEIPLYTYPVPANAAQAHKSGGIPAAAMALADALLFGFGLRRKAPNWLVVALFAVGSLAGLAGISACGAGSPLTHGTFAYSVVAKDANTNAALTSSFMVTVP